MGLLLLAFGEHQDLHGDRPVILLHFAHCQTWVVVPECRPVLSGELQGQSDVLAHQSVVQPHLFDIGQDNFLRKSGRQFLLGDHFELSDALPYVDDGLLLH